MPDTNTCGQDELVIPGDYDVAVVARPHGAVTVFFDPRRPHHPEDAMRVVRRAIEDSMASGLRVCA